MGNTQKMGLLIRTLFMAFMDNMQVVGAVDLHPIHGVYG